MDKIKSNLKEHKKLYIGLSIMSVISLVCMILRFVFYKIADVRYELPYADIGDLCAFISYFTGLFLAILLVGSIIWLIATKFGCKIHICWFIMGVNTLIVLYSTYVIIDDLFISDGWLKGLAALIFGIFVIPVNFIVYIFCAIRLRIHAKKSN